MREKQYYNACYVNAALVCAGAWPVCVVRCANDAVNRCYFKINRAAARRNVCFVAGEASSRPHCKKWRR